MDLDEAQLDAEERMLKTVADYDHFLKGVRTGQATVEILDGIQVDIPSYGGIVPLKSVAVIAKADARLLTIKPFDPKTIKEIEKALIGGELGITPNNDGKIIRLAFPPMSEERRQQTVKLLKDRLEQHKVAIRNIRKDALKHVEDNDGKPGVSEDQVKSAKDEIQELVKKYEGQLQTHYDKKSEQVMTV